MARRLSLKLTPGKLKQVRTACETIAAYLAEPGVADVVAEWPVLPEPVREQVRAAAPTFAAVLDLGVRIP